MTVPNIYDFIESPYKAVRAGYRPCYLDCVSAVSHGWWRGACFVGRAAAEHLVDLVDVVHMEIGTFFIAPARITLQLAAVLAFPVTMWFFAYRQYAALKWLIKDLERCKCP